MTTYTCGKAITAAEWNVERSAFLSASADGTIGLWDTRSGAGDQRRFKSHTGWISSLSFAPDDSYLFLSGSYDNTVKLWDVRSSIPLFTIGNNADVTADKVLAVAWGGQGTDILSGGTDKKLKVSQAPELKERK